MMRAECSRERGAARARALGAAAAAIAVCAAGAAAAQPAGVDAFLENCASRELSPSEAARFCTLAIASGELDPPTRARALLNRGAAMADQGGFERALGDYGGAARIAPDLFEVWPNKGWALIRLGRPGEAVESFSRALALRPDDVNAKIGRGAAHLRAGAAEIALLDLEDALARAPDSTHALYERGLALKALGLSGEAEASFTALLRRAPRDVPALLERAALRETMFPEGAIADYETSIGLSPENKTAHYRLGRLLDRLGRRAEADALLRRAWQLGWRDEWLHARMMALGG